MEQGEWTGSLRWGPGALLGSENGQRQAAYRPGYVRLLSQRESSVIAEV